MVLIKVQKGKMKTKSVLKMLNTNKSNFWRLIFIFVSADFKISYYTHVVCFKTANNSLQTASNPNKSCQ